LILFIKDSYHYGDELRLEIFTSQQPVATLHHPDKRSSVYSFFDDGTHGDRIPYDNIYTLETVVTPLLFSQKGITMMTVLLSSYEFQILE
jgi:hypothetical protein